MKRAFLVAVAAASLFHLVGAPLIAQTAAPLKFFQNYFVTGDYRVAGIGLYGSGGVGNIPVSGVPAGADILAAFLYWQVVGNVSAPDAGAIGATFRGNALTSGGLPFGKALGASSACLLSGGLSSGSRTFGFRADVLRYFNVDEGTGKQSVNGSHAVTIPNNGLSRPLGASLVIVYRDPNTAAPLKAVVLYDGTHTMQPLSGGIVQPIAGFYDGTPGPARLTTIVGSAQALLSERLRFNGALLATNPFRTLAGNQWDNPTFDVATPPPGASGVTSQVTVSADHQGILLQDCLSFAAMVYSTNVEDVDGDGLLDVWEESATPVLDPNGAALPNLNAMGASRTQRDVFVEVGYMGTSTPTTYGGTPQGPHSHLPPPESLQLVGDAFDRQGIRVHFDVGDTYPSTAGADPFVIRGAGLARGGEPIDELVTVNGCVRGATDPPWVCQFSGYPGTVGWKTGYRFLRDQVLTVNGNPPPAGFDEDVCGTVVGGVLQNCERRFDSNRQDMFFYSLFAHHIGLPKSEFPCLLSGVPVAGDANGACSAPGQVENPEFFMPRTNTGIGDFPGGDSLITLGGFKDVNDLPTGTPFMQASTLMHELGHNFERRHGGEAFEPNCKPTYLSVMNYLYQLRGLLDDGGIPHLDFSGSVGATVNESALNGSVASLYRLGWYAPLDASYLGGHAEPAGRHCNGSEITDGARFVHIDARLAADPVDWDADNNDTTTATAQDVNFSGGGVVNGQFVPGALEILEGSDDWSNIRMNQVGARRNVGAVYELSGPNLFGVGPLSIGMGKGDLGKGDLGKGDLGKGDLGKGDLGKGDLGKGDLGKGDLGKGDLGKGDLGGGDLFLGDPANPDGGEIDTTTAEELANTPPIAFSACLVGEPLCPDAEGPADGTFHDVRATFEPPTVGGVSSYTMYRVEGPELLPPSANQLWVPVAEVDAESGADFYSLIDTSNLVNNQQYTFFVVATYADGTDSDPSNLVTITAINAAPVAGNDGPYATNEDTPFSLAVPGVLANDDDPDSEDALDITLVAGPLHAESFSLNEDGSFNYTPADDYNGPDSFTYTVTSGGAVSNTATVSITVSAVNDNPVANPDSATVAEDSGANPIAVLANDNDGPDGEETLAVIAVTQGAHGTVTFTATGVSYTPAANYYGPDAFTYTIGDGNGGTATATVSITVTAVDDPPTANPDSYATNEDTVLNVAAPGVLANDSDDSTLTASLVAGSATNGTVSLSTNGGFIFTPAANFKGTATFSYRATGGGVSSGPTLVTITVASVNDAPAGNNRLSWDRRNQTNTIRANDFGFTDPKDTPPNAFLSVKIVSLPSSSIGTLKLIPAGGGPAVPIAVNAFISKADLDAGRFVFVPKPNTIGITSFNFQVRDNGGTALGGVDLDPTPNTVIVKVIICGFSDDDHDRHGHP